MANAREHIVEQFFLVGDGDGGWQVVDFTQY